MKADVSSTVLEAMRHSTPIDSKRALRRAMRSAVLALPRTMRIQADAAIATRVTGLEAWRTATNILLYYALPDEVSTRWLMETALEDGKKLYLPRVEGGSMTFHEVDSIETLEGLEAGAFGIAAPGADAARWRSRSDAAADIDDASSAAATGDAAANAGGAAGSSPRTLVLCPGRAFDRDGNRLGRGGGYYDRFLPALREDGGEAPHPVVAGLCYTAQLVADVPAQPGDQRVDLIVTEDEVIAI